MTAHRQQVAGTSARSAADAIDDLYRAYANGLVRFALMLVGDRGRAEDVVQEAFVAGGLRASADGRTVAYAASLCPQTVKGQEAIGIISTATGHVTQWTMPVRWYLGRGSISLSADGRLIGLGIPNAGDALSNFHRSGPEPGVWVLPADSAPGTVAQRGREVVKVPRSTPIGPIALTTDGMQVYVNTSVQLSADLDLATGKLTMLSAHLSRHALVDDAAW